MEPVMYEASMEADYYAILGVERDAALSAVRDRYRRLMQQSRLHPDLGGDTRVAALINKAYSVLGNPALRNEYDARLFILERVAEGFSNETPEPATATGPAAAAPSARACVFCGEPDDTSPQDDLGCSRCGSALRPADTQRLESFGNRAVQRLGRSLDIQLFTRFPQRKGIAARTEDVSLQGLRLIARCALRQGQRVRMVSDTFDAVGEIVHAASQPSAWRPKTIAGISFLTLRFARPAGVFVSCQI